MKKTIAGITAFYFFTTSIAQNVGIGITNPAYPLSFPNTLGDKISLYGSTGNHYGFGIQGSLMQMYSDAPEANIGFGHGYSSNFTERMRIINSGGDGLQLSGRIVLKNGTSPLDPAYGTGVWMYKADNSGMLGFIGVENNQNLGFYGGPAGWGFTYDAINSRVGIGTSTPSASLMINSSMNPQLHIRQISNADYARIRMQTGSNRYWDIAGYNDATTVSNDRLNFYHSQAGDILSLSGNGRVGIGNANPNAPLTFAASLGKKITLYPGASGDVGFGVAGNRLQIYSDNSNADVAIGFDGSGLFNERFAFKPNGAIAINGNTGTAGQVIQSNGAGAATWSSPSNLLYNNTHQLNQPGNAIVITASASNAAIPGIETSSFSLNLPNTSNKIVLSFKTMLGSELCAFCDFSYASFNIRIYKDGIIFGNFINNAQIVNGSNMSYNTGMEVFTVPAGTYTFSANVNNTNTHYISLFISRLFIMAIPQ